MRHLAAALASAAIILALILPPQRSGANFTSSVPASAAAKAGSVSSYLSLWSQDTDPAGLTGYAVKNLSSPPVLAATGASDTLSLALGGWKNGGTMNRVFTLGVKSSIPWSSVTITATVPPTPTQPVSDVALSAVGSTGGTSSVTLTPGSKRQVNLTLKKLPGNNVTYSSFVQLTLTYPGYTSNFYTYSVPFTAWDGNGSGP